MALFFSILKRSKKKVNYFLVEKNKNKLEPLKHTFKEKIKQNSSDLRIDVFEKKTFYLA
jgi:hypothetical protein